MNNSMPDFFDERYFSPACSCTDFENINCLEHSERFIKSVTIAFEVPTPFCSTYSHAFHRFARSSLLASAISELLNFIFVALQVLELTASYFMAGDRLEHNVDFNLELR